MIYKSKSNTQLKVLFVLLMLVILIFSIKEKSWALLSIVSAFTFFILYLFYTTTYTIEEDILTVKSGFLFTEDVEINSIKKITQTKKHLLSGPGFSVDRLIVDFNDHDRVIISPEKNDEFIAHLQSINPAIEIETKEDSGIK